MIINILLELVGMCSKGVTTNDVLIALDLPLVIDEAGRWLIVPNTHRWCQFPGVNYRHNLIADLMLFSLPHTAGDRQHHAWPHSTMRFEADRLRSLSVVRIRQVSALVKTDSHCLAL